MYSGRVVGIRPIEPADLTLLTNLANDPELRQLVVGWDWPISESGQAEWLSGQSANPNTRRLTIVDRATNSAIGVTGFWDIDWHNRSALSAIKLDRDLAPRGAGSDAIMLTGALAFYEVGLRRLWSSILSFNVASYEAYIRKCGWRVEGTELESVFKSGEWVDLRRVAILKSDFALLDSADEYRAYVCPGGSARVGQRSG